MTLRSRQRVFENYIPIYNIINMTMKSDITKKNNEKNKRDNMCYSVSSQIKKCNVF